jgi:pimeloyl-ACP methyl ester carboxylesterase
MRLPFAIGLALLACGCSSAGGSGDPSGAGSPGAPTGGGDTPGDPSPGTSSAAASRCTVGPTEHDIACDHQTSTLGGRTVDWETPLGTPPADGWPLVVVYQGSLLKPDGQSLLSPHGMWKVTAADGDAYGASADYVITQLTTQTSTIKGLLDGGFAVATPTADNTGFAWDTNLPPWLYDWPPAPDNQFLTQQLFAAVEAGQLGPVSTTRWYATGVSSGGYMTSRMAVSYAGRFRALVIAAGSYATCGGGLPCNVPALPKDHPPTLFLHGAKDPLVPLSQMQSYYDALMAGGFETQVIIDPDLTHGWAVESPVAIPAWFSSH